MYLVISDQFVVICLQYLVYFRPLSVLCYRFSDLTYTWGYVRECTYQGIGTMYVRGVQTAFIRHGTDSTIYKFWKNKVKREIMAAKRYYYQNRAADVEHTNPKKWWKQMKSLTGQGIQNEWYHRFLEGTKNTEFLANRINLISSPVLQITFNHLLLLSHRRC